MPIDRAQILLEIDELISNYEVTDHELIWLRDQIPYFIGLRRDRYYTEFKGRFGIGEAYHEKESDSILYAIQVLYNESEGCCATISISGKPIWILEREENGVKLVDSIVELGYSR